MIRTVYGYGATMSLRLRKTGRRGLPCSLQAKPTDMALMWTFNEAGAQKINFLVLDPAKGDAGKDGGDKGFSWWIDTSIYSFKKATTPSTHPRMGKCLPGWSRLKYWLQESSSSDLP